MGIKNSIKRNKLRLTAYGLNLVVPPIVGVIKNSWEIYVSPVAAVFYGGLDVARTFSKTVRDSKYTRFAQGLGAIGFTGKTLADVANIAAAVIPGGSSGDFSSLYSLVLDGPMAVSLIKDTWNAYENYSFVQDIKSISSRFRKNFDEEVEE